MTHPEVTATRLRSRRTLLAWPAAWALLLHARRAGAQAGRPTRLVIGGTGSGIAPLRVLAAMPGVDAEFVPNLGSGGGLKALAAGALDLAVSARPLSDAERQAGLVALEAFRTPFVFGVHPSVPTTGSTLAALADYYAGRTANWSHGELVRLVLRPESDSDSALLRATHPAMAAALASAQQRPGIKMAVTDDDAVADIERIVGALGTTSLALVAAQQRAVRVLDIDGVRPGVATLASGQYRWAKTLWLVTRGTPHADAQHLLRLLASGPGREALARCGCLVMGQA